MSVRPAVFAVVLLSGASGAAAQAPRGREIRNEVEGRVAILMLKPEGSSVSKGEVIAELDSAALRDRLVNQEILVNQARAAYEVAQDAVEPARAAIKEVAAEIEARVETLRGGIKTAEINIKLAKQKIEEAKTQQALQQGRGELDTATTNLALAEADLTKAKTRLDTMLKFTKKRRLLEAETEVGKAESAALAKKAVFALETTKAEKITRMIDKCRITAPIDGILSYANPEVPDPNGEWVEEGAFVRERQLLLRIIPRSNDEFGSDERWLGGDER